MTDLELYFRYRCERGLEARGLSGNTAYEERLKYEISIITQMGFAGYFLVVSDVVAWAVSHSIPVGPGRGSAAGSLVSYVLKITHLDPIKYGLLFERFLNPDRVSMPDADIDFCEERRSEVIKYIEDKYGSDHVAHIGTFGSMKAKASIRDVARTKGYSYDVGDALARQTLDPIEGKAQPLATCYEKVPGLRKIRYGAPSESRDILEWAEQVEDRKRSFSTHASGIVISDCPIAKVVPIYPGKDDQKTTQFEMNTVEEIGLVKFDFLGLRALTTIQRCIDLVRQRHNKTIDILSIPVDDDRVYTLLRSGDVAGIFQLEGSSGMRDLLVKIQPFRLEDLAVLVAIYRPGPLGSDMLQHYLQVRAGEESPQYATPELEPILSYTDGMLIYQEQVMEICKQLAGYTMAEADNMRKIVGKKLPEKMAKEKDKFLAGLQKNNISIDIARQIWADIETFAAYGFNRAHAVCYALISYQMAYLKTYYPMEFMCSCLTSDSDTTDKVIQYISHCQDRGIDIRGPSVNKSQYNFSVSSDGKAIRFGLSAVKNLGVAAAEIIEERNRNGAYVDILDFCRRVDLSQINKRKLESLVLSGAFDDSGYTRASLIAAVESVLDHKDKFKSYESKMETYRKRMIIYLVRDKQIAAWETSREGKKPARLKLPEKPTIPEDPSIPKLEEMVIQELLVYEKELTGYFISGHPLDQVTERTRKTISALKEMEGGKIITKIIAIPSMIKETTTKKTKQKMAYVDLEDKTGTIQAIVLPKHYAQFKNLIDIKTPACYEVELEITESDTGRVTRLMVLNVTPLKSVEAYQNRPIELTVPISKLGTVAERISQMRGRDVDVYVRVQSNDRSTWDLGVYRCSGSRDSVQKILLEL